MKNDDSNDLGTKGALSEDLLTQVAGGGFPLFEVPFYKMKCRECAWEKSGNEPGFLKGLARNHTQETGHETYFSS